jgi:hypothetical protein
MKDTQGQSVGKRRGSMNEGGNVSLRRHEYHCTVCAHPRREEIESDWIGWGRTSRIAENYHIRRDSHYRHAHALPASSDKRAGLNPIQPTTASTGSVKAYLSLFKPHSREDFTLAIAGTREPETI